MSLAWSFFENRHFTDNLGDVSTPTNKTHGIRFTSSPLPDIPDLNSPTTNIISADSALRDKTPISSSAYRRLREQFRKNKMMSSPALAQAAVIPGKPEEFIPNAHSTNNMGSFGLTPSFDLKSQNAFKPSNDDLFARGLLCFQLV